MCLAVPGRVLEIEAAEGIVRRGRVDFAGIVREVNLAVVPEARVGDYVIVHAGVALSVLDEDEAQHVLEMLAALEAAGADRDRPHEVP